MVRTWWCAIVVASAAAATYRRSVGDVAAGGWTDGRTATRERAPEMRSFPPPPPPPFLDELYCPTVDLD